MGGTYTRSPERGFRKFAMAFWDRPREGMIYGGITADVTKTRRFQAEVQAKHGVWPSVAQLMGRAVAESYKLVPEANAKIIWGQAYIKDTTDVYFQVDVEGGKDLSGVVIEDVGNKTCVDVANELVTLATKLRKGEDEQYEKTQKGCVGMLPSWVMRRLLKVLTFLEYNLGHTPTWLGARPEPFGTVMVSNVSKFGVDICYAPLVPVSRVPLVILVGQVKEQALVIDGEVVPREAVSLSATFDHRLLDGYKIGKFTRSVRRYMENPYLYEAEALGLENPFPEEPKPDKTPAATLPAATPPAATPPAATPPAATPPADAPASEA